MRQIKYLFYGLIFIIVTIFVCEFINDNRDVKTVTNEQSQLNGNVGAAGSKKILPKTEVEKELMRLAEGLDVKYDNMKEITYYYCPQDYDIGIKLLPYLIVDKNYGVTIFDCPVCHGDEWLFFDTVYIKYDGHLYKNSYDKSKRQSQVGRRSVTELYSVPLSGDWYKILHDACNYQNVKIRFSGKFDVDKFLDDKEIKNIKKVFTIYEFLDSVNVQ